MIDFFFGKPRTGKTYRAVKFIFDEYIVLKAKPKYKNIITNIGGFKFEDINEHFKLDYSDRFENAKTEIEEKKVKLCSAKKLVWKDFYEHLVILYDMAVNNESDDIKLNEYADKSNINDALIVIDEASFYLKKYDDVISWWLAYHGHFRIRIIIIAQSPKQIYREYMEHTELYYEAQPQSKQLKSNNFRYIIYDSYNFSKDSKYGSDTIKSSQKIFDLYKSGEVDKPKKMLYKFFFLMAIAIVIMIGFFKLLMFKLSPSSEDIDNSIDIEAPLTQIITNEYKPLPHNTFLMNVRCSDSYCWNTNQKYEDNQITIAYFTNIVDSFELELKFYEIKNEIFQLIPQKRGYRKINLASLTDFYYEVPKDLKTSYLSDLFVLKEIKRKNNFNTGINKDLFFNKGSEESE